MIGSPFLKLFKFRVFNISNRFKKLNINNIRFFIKFSLKWGLINS